MLNWLSSCSLPKVSRAAQASETPCRMKLDFNLYLCSDRWSEIWRMKIILLFCVFLQPSLQFFNHGGMKPPLPCHAQRHNLVVSKHLASQTTV